MNVQWNLRIKDTLVQGNMSTIERCPLNRGFFYTSSMEIQYFGTQGLCPLEGGFVI